MDVLFEDIGEQVEEGDAVMFCRRDRPMVGFFGNGEISHNRLYGYTGVLTLFV